MQFSSGQIHVPMTTDPVKEAHRHSPSSHWALVTTSFPFSFRPRGGNGFLLLLTLSTWPSHVLSFNPTYPLVNSHFLFKKKTYTKPVWLLLGASHLFPAEIMINIKGKSSKHTLSTLKFTQPWRFSDICPISIHYHPNILLKISL